MFDFFLWLWFLIWCWYVWLGFCVLVVLWLGFGLSRSYFWFCWDYLVVGGIWWYGRESVVCWCLLVCCSCSFVGFVYRDWGIGGRCLDWESSGCCSGWVCIVFGRFFVCCFICLFGIGWSLVYRVVLGCFCWVCEVLLGCCCCVGRFLVFVVGWCWKGLFVGLWIFLDCVENVV